MTDKDFMKTALFNAAETPGLPRMGAAFRVSNCATPLGVSKHSFPVLGSLFKGFCCFGSSLSA